MRLLVISIYLLTIYSFAFGQDGAECPNRGIDPSKFCIPGQTWNEEMKKCVNLV